MTETTLFMFKDHEVRTAKIGGEPWFVAADVCLSIGYSVKSDGSVNVYNALRTLDADEVTTHRISGNRGTGSKFVSESGLFKLIMRSDKREAKDFQNWVTKVVLPAIRKDGGYIHGEEHVVSGAMTEDELVFKAMEVSYDSLDTT
ncbi:MAG TPA: BRO family protein [Ensifer sp.]|jgi:prophage antirepressor-like protein|uniref:BRO-N domain-containing protein n=1 Tax=Ensifer sp. TaxID=1872086 RepID=UPI002E0F330D|nr:BRO family protein [Ensifer sp.]